MRSPVTGWGPRLADRYRPVLTVPHLPSLLVWGMVARLHLSATVIALLLMVQESAGSYVKAGTVTGALVLGQGVAGPWRGRAVDRGPAARLLIYTSLIYGGALAVLAAAASTPWPVLAGIALVVGLALPPGTQVARAKVAQLVSGPLRRSAFSLQVTGNEVVLAVGPPLVVVAIAVWNAQAGLLMCALAAAAGGLLLARAVHRAGVNDPPAAEPATSTGSVRRVRVRAAVLVAALTAMVAAFAIIDLTLIAWTNARGTPVLGGGLIAVWAIGSAVGGLVSAASTGQQARLGRRFTLVTIGIGTLALALATDEVWVVALVLLIGGATIPAAVAAGYEWLTDAVPSNRRAEIFGWLAAATTAGTAVAAPTAGAVFDRAGPAVAVAVAAAAAALATALAAHRRLRPRSASDHPPPPRTEPSNGK